jgi:hypothetical protein
MKDGFARARHRIDLTTELKSRDKSLPNGVASSRTNQDARIGVRCLYSHGPYFEKVNYGLDGFDDREKQSIAGMLRIPFMDSWGSATVDPPSLKAALAMTMGLQGCEPQPYMYRNAGIDSRDGLGSSVDCRTRRG